MLPDCVKNWYPEIFEGAAVLNRLSDFKNSKWQSRCWPNFIGPYFKINIQNFLRSPIPNPISIFYFSLISEHFCYVKISWKSDQNYPANGFPLNLIFQHFWHFKSYICFCKITGNNPFSNCQVVSSNIEPPRSPAH